MVYNYVTLCVRLAEWSTRMLHWCVSLAEWYTRMLHGVSGWLSGL